MNSKYYTKARSCEKECTSATFSKELNRDHNNCSENTFYCSEIHTILLFFPGRTEPFISLSKNCYKHLVCIILSIGIQKNLKIFQPTVIAQLCARKTHWKNWWSRQQWCPAGWRDHWLYYKVTPFKKTPQTTTTVLSQRGFLFEDYLRTAYFTGGELTQVPCGNHLTQNC